jgi:hypothetical protein
MVESEKSYSRYTIVFFPFFVFSLSDAFVVEMLAFSEKTKK